MNAGLSNLTTLKRHLLPESWTTETTLDEILVDLGTGVASQLEEFCGRKFARVVADTFETSAENGVVQLPRFPLEALPTVELRAAGDTAWETQDGTLDQWTPGGVLIFNGPLGTHRDRLRITYTGGYWWDDSEDASGTQPGTATAVPAGLLLAWLTQCKHVFAHSEAMNRKSLATEAQQDAAKANPILELLPAVRTALQPYRILVA